VASNGVARKRNGRGLGHRGLPIDHLTHTNQPKTGTTMEGSMKGRHNKWEVQGKHDIIVSGGVRVRMEVKTKIKSLSLLVTFFLSSIIG
jgi:hypothetical protein